MTEPDHHSVAPGLPDPGQTAEPPHQQAHTTSAWDTVRSAEAAHALGELLATAPPWLPSVGHWEIAKTDSVWGVSGELAADEGKEVATLRALAAALGDTPANLTDEDRMVTARFAWASVPFRLWHLRPMRYRNFPRTCSTCPAELGAGASFVWLGEGPGAPVICLPCRDRMHADWVAKPDTADGTRIGGLREATDLVSASLITDPIDGMEAHVNDVIRQLRRRITKAIEQTGKDTCATAGESTHASDEETGAR